MKIGMENRIEPNIKIEQSQKLVLTPEMIQTIEILRLNMYELENFVSEKLLENPMLDRGRSEDAKTEGNRDDDSGYTLDENRRKKEEAETPEIKDKSDELDWSEYLSNTAYDDISYRSIERTGSKTYDSNEYYMEPSAEFEQTLEDVLMLQLEFSNESFLIKSTASYIIQSLDENGYLRCKASDIADELNISIEEAEAALQLVQTFEPYGVGARNLNECMLIQLKNSGMLSELTEKIVMDHLEDIAKNRIVLIAKKTGYTIQEVQKATDFIKSLEPKPGRSYRGTDSIRFVVPDVRVEYDNGSFTIDVNEEAVPSLIISPMYRRILSASEKNSEEEKYLTDRLNSALWLIRSIEQRNETIYNVVKAIVEYQKEFFNKGSKYLKPMTLKQVGEIVGVHESTVSRTVNGKYMQSPAGVFELRYFFDSGVKTKSGQDVSAKGIKAAISEFIESEEQSEPLSDSAITELLKENGINISRRTVAKYREEMKIPSSSVRRRF